MQMILMLIAIFAFPVVADAAPRTSVCKLIDAPQEVLNRKVEVEARYLSGREGAVLVGENCKGGVKLSFKFGRVRWALEDALFKETNSVSTAGNRVLAIFRGRVKRAQGKVGHGNNFYF